MSDRKDSMTLGQQIDQLLAQMRFVAEAAGASLEQESASADADRSPVFGGRALADEFEASVRALIKRGEDKLYAFQHSPRPPDDQQKAYRDHVISAHEGRHYEEAAAIEGVSPSYMRQVRKERGREQTYGRDQTHGKERHGPTR